MERERKRRQIKEKVRKRKKRERERKTNDNFEDFQGWEKTCFRHRSRNAIGTTVNLVQRDEVRGPVVTTELINTKLLKHSPMSLPTLPTDFIYLLYLLAQTLITLH